MTTDNSRRQIDGIIDSTGYEIRVGDTLEFYDYHAHFTTDPQETLFVDGLNDNEVIEKVKKYEMTLIKEEN